MIYIIFNDLYYYLPLNPKDQPNAQTLTDYGGGLYSDYFDKDLISVRRGM